MQKTNFNPELQKFTENAKTFKLFKELEDGIDYVYEKNDLDDSSANPEDIPGEILNAESHYFHFKKMNIKQDDPITLDLATRKDGSKVFAIYHDAAPLLYHDGNCGAIYQPLSYLNSKTFLNELKEVLNERYEEYNDKFFFN